MTIDKEKLKALAWFTEDHMTDKSATTYDPAVAYRWVDKGWPVHLMYGQEAVDALLAEIERLERKNANQAETISQYQDHFGGGDPIVMLVAERDQLKAENEALHQSKDRTMALLDQLEAQHAELKAALKPLELDAERYRWLRESSQCDWDACYGKLELRIETPHFDASNLDTCIDAAMAKVASHG